VDKTIHMLDIISNTAAQFVPSGADAAAAPLAQSSLRDFEQLGQLLCIQEFPRCLRLAHNPTPSLAQNLVRRFPVESRWYVCKTSSKFGQTLLCQLRVVPRIGGTEGV
jgi:hypothetical protein